jgi:hypothetical protein
MAPTSVARLDSRLKASALGPAVAGMQKNQVIADFLRNFMGDDGQRCDDAEFGTFQKCGGDQDAIDKIVKGIADQDQQTGAP